MLFFFLRFGSFNARTHIVYANDNVAGRANEMANRKKRERERKIKFLKCSEAIHRDSFSRMDKKDIYTLIHECVRSSC